MTRSSSLSVSSYSSWLLVAPPCVEGWPTIKEAGIGCCCCCETCDRLRRGGYEVLPTLSPVVTISSPMLDKDEDEGCDATSTQDSGVSEISPWGDGAPDRFVVPAVLLTLRCAACRARCVSEGAIVGKQSLYGRSKKTMAVE